MEEKLPASEEEKITLPIERDIENISFERFKYYVELAKWFMVSFVLVVMTIIIDTGFKDRSAGIEEIKQYDKYVTDRIVLNSNIASRRLLAQYYSEVTASDLLRKRWKKYYEIVDNEYKDALKQIDSIKSVNNKLSELLKFKKNRDSIRIAKKIEENNRQISSLTGDTKPDFTLSLPVDVQTDEWVIVAGGYKNIIDAKNKIKSMTDRKLNFLIYKKHNMFRIIIGPYQTNDAAQTDNNLIQTRVGVNSYVVRLNLWCPNSKLDSSKEFLECQ